MGSAQGPEQVFGFVLIFDDTEHFGMEISFSFGGKGHQEMADQISVQVTYTGFARVRLDCAVDSAPDIYSYCCQSFIHGHHSTHYTNNALLSPQCLVESLA
jgi:hypothetical protein